MKKLKIANKSWVKMDAITLIGEYWNKKCFPSVLKELNSSSESEFRRIWIRTIIEIVTKTAIEKMSSEKLSLFLDFKVIIK